MGCGFTSGGQELGSTLGVAVCKKKRHKSLPSVLLNCSLDLLFQTMIRLVTGFLEGFFFLALI